MPVICSKTQQYLGVITKNDILDAVLQNGLQNYVQLMDTLVNVNIYFKIINKTI